MSGPPHSQHGCTSPNEPPKVALSALQGNPGTRIPRQTELPDCLQHHTKSQATGQKTQLFSAVMLLNLIFPTSSWSCSSRMKCILGLCHKTLHFVKTIHLALVICKYETAHGGLGTTQSLPGSEAIKAADLGQVVRGR